MGIQWHLDLRLQHGHLQEEIGQADPTTSLDTSGSMSVLPLKSKRMDLILGIRNHKNQEEFAYGREVSQESYY